jgi:Ca2+-binding EF-hand superfamily protein
LADLDGEIYLKVETIPTADVNGDGVVNIQDLVIIANAFGEAEPDHNRDGVVNIQDLVLVANAF